MREGRDSEETFVPNLEKGTKLCLKENICNRKNPLHVVFFPPNNLHLSCSEKGKVWITKVTDAILEKCNKDGAQILHIFVDDQSKEVCRSILTFSFYTRFPIFMRC